MFKGRPRMRLLVLVLLLATSAGWLFAGQQGETRAGRSADAVPAAALPAASHYDVLVVGSEPEAIMAAVAAAQEGARTLLVTRDARLGGLFVLGQMNSLDLRTQPELYQRGLFLDWWTRVGRGTSFDVGQAERAFEDMLAEAGVTVRRSVPALRPLVEGSAVRGVALVAASGDERIVADHVIDGTADADFAARAGARFSIGFRSLGWDARMADTLVFRIDGIDWQALKEGIEEHGRDYARIDHHVAWGHFGGYPAAYEPVEPGLRLRGLNLGQQNDGSVLVNALLVYGIDPFDPKSRADGYGRAAREAPRIVAYLRKLPGFERARFGGVADRLYIRDTRHLEAVCTLSVDDVLDNRVTDQAVAAGGYPLDVQTLESYDSGYVFGMPEIYGVRLCVTIPQALDGLWVVGKAAGYDPLAASSARVVPFGMALGEAVGVAAAQAAQEDLSPAAFAADPANIAKLRRTLEARGAYLPEVESRAPVGPYQHPAYASYRLMLRRGLAVGGYDNDPDLDEEVTALSYVYLLANVAKRFLAMPELAPRLVANFQYGTVPLAPDLALQITRYMACRVGVCTDGGWEELKSLGVVPQDFSPDGVLTRGQAYVLAGGLARLQPARLAEQSEP
ncbi:MAG TPA: FAD-dependent oxidoreductase [Trueperaceae bacterium]